MLRREIAGLFEAGKSGNIKPHGRWKQTSFAVRPEHHVFVTPIGTARLLKRLPVPVYHAVFEKASRLPRGLPA
ncbi:MAG: hypothetical protein LT080_04985 [Thiobacillus sp.]|nr:hypothetical protein [Thiobacillus sp.]